jgi:hypothetical protein
MEATDKSNKVNYSMYKLEVKLKQHTPLIHFQHDQEGATLRASEVKPKLDRFIINKLREEQITIEHIKSTHDALDYKIKIKSDKLKTYTIHDRYPLFFGNMGDGERKEFRYCNGYTKIEFQTFHEEIIKYLKRYLVEFFLCNNFGTRQSKGFGAFFFDNSDPLYQSPWQTQLMDYRFIVNVSKDLTNQWKTLFEYIELFYKTLRSGLNICNKEGNSAFYIKPIIFKYAKERGLQWDKKTIKETYLARDLSAQQLLHPDEELADVIHYKQDSDENQKYIFKDLLGLSSDEKWRSYEGKVRKKSVTKSVERFKSPIFFKPFRISEDSFNVFFKSIEIPKDYLGHEFIIKFNGHSNLTLPVYHDFDIDKFLNYAIFGVDLTELLGAPNYIGHPKFKMIQDMFAQIRGGYE